MPEFVKADRVIAILESPRGRGGLTAREIAFALFGATSPRGRADGRLVIAVLDDLCIRGIVERQKVRGGKARYRLAPWFMQQRRAKTGGPACGQGDRDA